MASGKISPLKLIFGSLWLGLFLVVSVFWWRSQLSLTEIPRLLEQWLSDVGLFWAALIYIVIYAARYGSGPDKNIVVGAEERGSLYRLLSEITAQASPSIHWCI